VGFGRRKCSAFTLRRNPIPAVSLYTGTTIGTVYSVTIGYDIIKNGKHAIDYLGTYNNTETTADPCSDIISGCTPAGFDDTVPVPPDTSNALVGALGTVSQPPGVFTIWGGTFHYTGSVAPFYNNYVNGDTHRSITLTFKATGTNVVIAWGGHVAWAGDWGSGNSAGGISGASYHTNLDACGGFNGCGGLDVGLTADAAAPAGLIRIVKIASTATGTANVAFPFTASSDFSPLSFPLTDNNPTGGVLKESAAITSFGAAHTVTVTEGNTGGWTLSDAPTCTTNFGGTVVSTEAFLQPDSSDRAGAISAWVNPGGLVTCTFTNTRLAPTAAPASITGQVLSRDGLPMGRVSVSLVDVNTGEVKLTSSNSSGNYTFTGLTVEHFYRLTLSGKRAIFEDPVRDFVLHDDLTNVNFFCTNQ